MKLPWVLGLVLATLYPTSAAPVRPRQVKTKTAAVIPTGPRRPASRSEAAEQAKSGHAGKGNVHRVVVRRMVHGHWVTVSHVVHAKTGPVVPPHPDADRLKEIQQVLADKGYF